MEPEGGGKRGGIIPPGPPVAADRFVADMHTRVDVLHFNYAEKQSGREFCLRRSVTISAPTEGIRLTGNSVRMPRRQSGFIAAQN